MPRPIHYPQFLHFFEFKKTAKSFDKAVLKKNIIIIINQKRNTHTQIKTKIKLIGRQTRERTKKEVLKKPKKKKEKDTNTLELALL